MYVCANGFGFKVEGVSYKKNSMVFFSWLLSLSKIRFVVIKNPLTCQRSIIEKSAGFSPRGLVPEARTGRWG